MGIEHKKYHNESETVSIGCGVFDFLMKKKENSDLASKELEFQHSKDDTSSCKSGDEEGNNGEKKKKGLKGMIKEKISSKKENEKTENLGKNNGVGAETTANSEEKGFIKKIKAKLPGQGQQKKAHDCGSLAGHCSEEDLIKEKKGIFNKIKDKLPVGHNKSEEKSKEN